MIKQINFDFQPNNIFTPDNKTDKKPIIAPRQPIMSYCGYVRPDFDDAAVANGEKCARAVRDGFIADFEKNEEYVRRNGGGVDAMVHVSTFKIIDGFIYMTYYANVGEHSEDPNYQEARLSFCPENDTDDMTVITIQKVGDMLDGKCVDKVYDTILLYKGGDELYILWTAAVDGMYYRFYRTFNIKTHTLGAIFPNKFKVGDIINDFSTSGMKAALCENEIPYKQMIVDIGIMQKLSTRVENGETYYYTGAYSGYYTCIIKSRDFITWEYVSTPDFINFSLWENATYVLGDKVFYFVRQEDDVKQGFLTVYDLKTKTWAEPFLIRDSQSRSDFVYYENKLYLIHSPKNREGFGIVLIDTEDISKSRPLAVCDMKESLFYPYTEIHGDMAYMSYTVDRKHIRLCKYDFSAFAHILDK